MALLAVQWHGRMLVSTPQTVRVGVKAFEACGWLPAGPAYGRLLHAERGDHLQCAAVCAADRSAGAGEGLARQAHTATRFARQPLLRRDVQQRTRGVLKYRWVRLSMPARARALGAFPRIALVLWRLVLTVRVPQGKR